ncbi:Uncharacterised protein [Salmonella enterica subsp. enterica]|uniref:Uncharacterized protein n=1 Tax=Salmonella enterica I TaxID=59201 RepID=A0A3S4IML5_SALET|nr:Uncharacterised protein [Salmonella enterica subsp. enterica]
MIIDPNIIPDIAVDDASVMLEIPGVCDRRNRHGCPDPCGWKPMSPLARIRLPTLNALEAISLNQFVATESG